MKHANIGNNYINQLINSNINNGCVLLRKQSLVLVAWLLSADYLKCRGSIFYQFLLALVDDNNFVRAIANVIIKETLKMKMQFLSYTHILEIIFFLNDCQNKNLLYSYINNNSKMIEAEHKFSTISHSFSGTSDNCRKARHKIYTTLLEFIGPEHKGHIALKLCDKIITPISEKIIKLQGNIEEMLLDTFWIIAYSYSLTKNSNMKKILEGLKKFTRGMKGPQPVKGVISYTMMCRGLIEGIIPTFVKMYDYLNEYKHPKLKNLINTLAIILKNIRFEINNISTLDQKFNKELVSKIQFTMKSLDKFKNFNQVGVLKQFIYG